MQRLRGILQGPSSTDHLATDSTASAVELMPFVGAEQLRAIVQAGPEVEEMFYDRCLFTLDLDNQLCGRC